MVHHSGSLFVDSVTGMVLTRVGHMGANGYERVNVDGRETTVHRVVVEALHGQIPEGLTVNHLDGDKANNRPDNLELATQGEQVAHAYRIGLRVGNGNTGRARTSRVTPDQAAQIKAAPRGEVTALCERLGVNRQWAYAIRSGRGPLAYR